MTSDTGLFILVFVAQIVITGIVGVEWWVLSHHARALENISNILGAKRRANKRGA